jgi:hypothetical protein
MQRLNAPGQGIVARCNLPRDSPLGSPICTCTSRQWLRANGIVGIANKMSKSEFCYASPHLFQ